MRTDVLKMQYFLIYLYDGISLLSYYYPMFTLLLPSVYDTITQGLQYYYSGFTLLLLRVYITFTLLTLLLPRNTGNITAGLSYYCREVYITTTKGLRYNYWLYNVTITEGFYYYVSLHYAIVILRIPNDIFLLNRFILL